MSKPPPMLPPGSRLGGYEVGALVGRGGMGEVYRAKQLSMDREVALKVLSPKLARQDPSFADKFVAEARAAGRLNHPNIVGVHDVGNAAAPEGCHGVAANEIVHYFSMEFIEGETVKDVIERQGAVDIETVARIMTGMGEALAFAEAHKIVHRDIKPDNIMLTGNGLVKLADLGLALHTDSEEAVVGAGKDEQGRSKVMGTPLYMAPEQARAQPVDHRADQYALGATLYHMLTGRPPYTGESAKAIMRAHCFEEIPDPEEENPETPPIWRELCMRLMAKAADERFASAAELRAAIKAAARWKPGTRLRSGSGQAHSSFPTAQVVVAVVVAAAGLWWFLWRSPSPQAAPVVPAQPVQAAPSPHPPKPTSANPVRQPAAAALAALPSDPAEALAVLERLLADPGNAAIRAELEGRRDQVRAAIEERRRAPLRATIDTVEADLAAGRLRTAHAAVARLPDEAWLATRRNELTSRLATAEQAIEKQLETTIAASDLAACATLRPEIENSELPDGRRAHLLARLEERRKGLVAKNNPPKQLPPQDSKPAWQQFRAKIETLRGAWPYAAFNEGCNESARALPEAERHVAQTLGTISEQAQRVETALRLHIAQTSPKLECRLGNRSGTFVITRLEKDWVGFRLPDVPAESRSERGTAQLPWQRLISAALATNGGADARAEAAFLWYWRHAEAQQALARLGDDPLATALALLERKTRPLEIPGELTRREDGAVAVSYPFQRKDAELLRAWRGEGLSQVERGMRWGTTAVIERGSTNERDLPTLRWDATLRAPCTLEASVHPEADTEVVLVGLTSGELTARIALNHKLRKAFMLATREDDANIYQALGNKTAVDYSGMEAVRLRLSIDAAGKLSTWVNDKPLQVERTIVFPADARVSPVIQGRPVDKGSALTIAELTITGKL